MSLTDGKAVLTADLLEIFTSESQATENPAQSRQRIAQNIANAIDKFVRSGNVNVDVKTTGTATAQTGTGTGKIS
ncbi:hypothetical protein DBR39_13785 [Chryseobacterium sp. KBW03]|uniref:hypothetical protein n=1 Tax=Chryseobacterium sp. KBW03 TaxID=2153362 RepID=UPI000F5A119C|nr:hypothetical protein [Chryseobacterium sp. KBW03]RQO37953.1 hypothetical protein DBR39_13785 [Chryseobacterium sp. KBW03]